LHAALARDRVDPAHQAGEEFARQVRQDHADGVGAAPAEAARRVVRAVVEVLRDFEYALAYRFGHVLAAIERSRHGRDGHVRQAGDILDRRAAWAHPHLLPGEAGDDRPPGAARQRETFTG